VADVFDFLTRIRSYRPAFKVAAALEAVKLRRGTQFDPDVVDAFFAAQPEIRRLRHGAQRIDALSRRSQKPARRPPDIKAGGGTQSA
jgi:HD-GYP domain-containing protein (c-di-GMP phosphodiesterase class II)